MKRWLGTAGLGGLTIMGAFAFPDAAAAAPGGQPGAPPGGPAKAKATASPSAAAPKANATAAAKANGQAQTKANSQAKATGQAKANTQATGRTNGQAKANPKPGRGNPNPGKGNPNPGKGNPNPGKGKGNPNPGKGKGNPNPGKGNPNPGKGNPNPGKGNPNPGKGNPNPGKGNPNPGRPATAEAAPAAAQAAAAPAAAPPLVAAAQVQVTICHATGSATNPFELITVAAPAAQAHQAHGDVAPVGGACPGAVTPPPPGGQVTICHRTGSETNPFEVITVDDNALPAHLAHGDVASVGGGCPGPIPPPPPVVQPDVVVPPPAVRPDVIVPVARREVVVLGTVREVVQAQSFSQVVPVVRAAERVRATGEKRTATLPATGSEVGALTLLGLLLLLAGARLTRHGKARTAMASPVMSHPVVPGSEMTVPSVNRSNLRAKAPPTLLRRRE